MLFVLLAVAAAARILLQVFAMPPYAGLDEAWHVARIAFVAREHRNPTIGERSIPPYIGATLRGGQPHWIIVDHPLIEADRVPYESPNYEAQQPPLYYSLAARLTSHASAIAELRSARLLSAFFAWIAIMAAASILFRYFGNRGLLVAALIASLPTWETLVSRASNDALACALVAIAAAITFSGRYTLLEAIAWELAIATKLYVWPIAIIVPILWRIQKGSRTRLIIVVLACAISALLTMRYLSTHTRNPLGDFGFDTIARAAEPMPIDYKSMIKITLASAVWMSGQHNDAMTPIAMLLYVVPLIALIRAKRSPYFIAAAGALIAFAFAHAFSAAGFIRQAQAAGLALPLGGKEGWYWYALAPLVIGFFAAKPRLAAIWMIVWDIVITEGALFHDYDGSSSPAHPSALFRWGPLHAPFTAHLDGSALIVLRLIQVAAIVALFVLESNLQGNSIDDSHSTR